MGERLNGLTEDEFKAILSENLRKKGFINNLKSQIRGRLINELSDKQTPQKPLKTSPPLHSAVNSLILHHFKSHHYDYSFSVFMPECGLDRILRLEEITPIMRGVRVDGGAHSALEEVLLSNKPQSLNEMFDALDELSYNKRLLNDFISLARHHKDQHLMDKVQDFDRENVKYRQLLKQELEKEKKKLQQTHDDEMRVIREREKEMRVQHHQQQDMLDKEAFMQRQKVLQEVQEVKMVRDSIKNKENLLDQQLHSLEESRRRFDEEMKRGKMELEEEKTKVLASLEAKACRLQRQFEGETGIFRETLDAKEKQLQKKEEDLKKENVRCDELWGMLRQKDEELNELKVQLSQSNGQVVLLGRFKEDKEKECSHQQKKLQQLQEKLNTTEADLRKLQKNNEAEQQRLKEEIVDLKEASKPSPSQQQQLQRLRNQVQQLHSSLLLQQQLNHQQHIDFTNKLRSQEWRMKEMADELSMMQLESGDEEVLREATIKLLSLENQSMRLDANMEHLMTYKTSSTLQPFRTHPAPRLTTHKTDIDLKSTPIIPSDYGHPLLNNFDAALAPSFRDAFSYQQADRPLMTGLGVDMTTIDGGFSMGDVYGGVEEVSRGVRVKSASDKRDKNKNNSTNEQKDNDVQLTNDRTPPSKQDPPDVPQQDDEAGGVEETHATNTTHNRDVTGEQNDTTDEKREGDEMGRYMSMMKTSKTSVSTSSSSVSSSGDHNLSDHRSKTKGDSGDEASW